MDNKKKLIKIGTTKHSSEKSDDFFILPGNNIKRWFKNEKERKKVIERDYSDFEVIEIE